MSRRTAAALIAATLGLTGCGGASHFADRSRPATPVNLSVYVNDRQVSVAPASVGAGPVDIQVVNSAATTELVTIRSTGGHEAAASTGPINPGTTASVQADLGTGSYTVSSVAAHSQFGARGIKPAELHVGKARPNGNNSVMQP